MVCIEKRPYTLYGRLATLHFRYLTCLLDRGHISMRMGKESMQNRKPMILVLAGPNGSGKSTITTFFDKVGK